MNRKIVLSIYGLMIATVSILFTSCAAEEGAHFAPRENEISFSTTKFNVGEITTDDGKVIKVPIRRSTNKGEFTTNVKYNTKDARFIADTLVTFANGDYVAYLNIEHPLADSLTAGVVYKVDLALVDSSLFSPSGLTSTTMSVSRKLTWNLVGEGMFSSELMAVLMGEVPPLSFEQEVDLAEESTVYRFKDVYDIGYSLYVLVNGNTVTIPEQQVFTLSVGLSEEYTPVLFEETTGTLVNGVLTVTVTPFLSDPIYGDFPFSALGLPDTYVEEFTFPQ